MQSIFPPFCTKVRLARTKGNKQSICLFLSFLPSLNSFLNKGARAGKKSGSFSVEINITSFNTCSISFTCDWGTFMPKQMQHKMLHMVKRQFARICTQPVLWNSVLKRSKWLLIAQSRIHENCLTRVGVTSSPTKFLRKDRQSGP